MQRSELEIRMMDQAFRLVRKVFLYYNSFFTIPPSLRGPVWPSVWRHTTVSSSWWPPMRYPCGFGWTSLSQQQTSTAVIDPLACADCKMRERSYWDDAFSLFPLSVWGGWFGWDPPAVPGLRNLRINYMRRGRAVIEHYRGICYWWRVRWWTGLTYQSAH